MIPTKEQVDIYFTRLVENCTDLHALLGDAARDLNAIFESTDKPAPAGESLAGMVLEAALGLALPEGKVFFSFVNHMIEGAKKMKEKVEEIRRYQKLVDAALQVATEDAASSVSTAYQNGAMGMIKTVDSIADKILHQKALNIQLWEVFKSPSLRAAKTAEPFFNSIQWAKPPALVSAKSEDIRYVFTYILVRLAVFRFVRLNLHQQSNPFELALTELLVTKIEPEGISENGCKYIFNNFYRSFPDSTNSGDVLPARNIVAIRNYYDMIDNWYPDISISAGSNEDMNKTMGDRKRRHFTTKMLMIANGFKKALPEVVMTPEFRLD
jgi:hypothetical protein